MIFAQIQWHSQTPLSAVLERMRMTGKLRFTERVENHFTPLGEISELKMISYAKSQLLLSGGADHTTPADRTVN